MRRRRMRGRKRQLRKTVLSCKKYQQYIPRPTTIR